MLPDDPRHGTEAGHIQHYRDREESCVACYDAKILAGRRRTKRKTMGHQYRRPLGDLHLVIQRWQAAGASQGEMGRVIGVGPSQVHRLVHGSPDTVVSAMLYRRIELAARKAPVTPQGITRRVQGLMWMGYTAAAISEASGVHVETIYNVRDTPAVFVSGNVRDSIVRAFDQLHMTFPEGTTKQHRAGIRRSQNTAQSRGWRAPLAWDHIDIDQHVPGEEYQDTGIDPVVVERVLNGQVPNRVSKAEKVEIVRRTIAAGLSLAALERLTGWQAHRYTPAVVGARAEHQGPTEEEAAA